MLRREDPTKADCPGGEGRCVHLLEVMKSVATDGRKEACCCRQLGSPEDWLVGLLSHPPWSLLTPILPGKDGLGSSCQRAQNPRQRIYLLFTSTTNELCVLQEFQTISWHASSRWEESHSKSFFCPWIQALKLRILPPSALLRNEFGVWGSPVHNLIL